MVTYNGKSYDLDASVSWLDVHPKQVRNGGFCALTCGAVLVLLAYWRALPGGALWYVPGVALLVASLITVVLSGMQMERAGAFGHVAKNCIANGDFQGAMKACDQLEKRGRADAFLLGKLGQALAEGGDAKAGIDVLAKSVALDPRFATIHAILGNAYLAIDDVCPAIEAFNRALALDGNNVIALNNIGVALARNGALDEATRALEHAVEVDPGTPVPRANLGIILAKAGDVDHAIEILEAAIETRRDHARTWFGLALALVLRGTGESKQMALAAVKEGAGCPGLGSVEYEVRDTVARVVEPGDVTMDVVENLVDIVGTARWTLLRPPAIGTGATWDANTVDRMVDEIKDAFKPFGP